MKIALEMHLWSRKSSLIFSSYPDLGIFEGIFTVYGIREIQQLMKLSTNSYEPFEGCDVLRATNHLILVLIRIRITILIQEF